MALTQRAVSSECKGSGEGDGSRGEGSGSVDLQGDGPADWDASVSADSLRTPTKQQKRGLSGALSRRGEKRRHQHEW